MGGAFKHYRTNSGFTQRRRRSQRGGGFFGNLAKKGFAFLKDKASGFLRDRAKELAPKLIAKASDAAGEYIKRLAGGAAGSVDRFTSGDDTKLEDRLRNALKFSDSQLPGQELQQAPQQAPQQGSGYSGSRRVARGETPVKRPVFR